MASGDARYLAAPVFEKFFVDSVSEFDGKCRKIGIGSLCCTQVA